VAVVVGFVVVEEVDLDPGTGAAVDHQEDAGVRTWAAHRAPRLLGGLPRGARVARVVEPHHDVFVVPVDRRRGDRRLQWPAGELGDVV
jgi:hypothetical protein